MGCGTVPCYYGDFICLTLPAQAHHTGTLQYTVASHPTYWSQLRLSTVAAHTQALNAAPQPALPAVLAKWRLNFLYVLLKGDKGNLAIKDELLSPDYIDHNRSDRLGRPSMPLLWPDWSQGNPTRLPRPTYLFSSPRKWCKRTGM